jgi:hypothetical protein
MQGPWHSPNKLHTMVYGQGFYIIIYHPLFPIERAHREPSLVPSNDYSRFWLSCLCPLVSYLHIICLSNISILSVPEEGYSRNAPCGVNLISAFLFLYTYPTLKAFAFFIPSSGTLNIEILERQIICK